MICASTFEEINNKTAELEHAQIAKYRNNVTFVNSMLFLAGH